MKINTGKGSHLNKLLFSTMLVTANRFIVTLAAFNASGRKFIPDLLNWDIFKQAAYTSLTRYDSGWYAQIAQWGYINEKSSAFFPLFPLLMRGFSTLSGLSFKICGQGISIFCFIIALWLVQILTEQSRTLRLNVNKQKAGRWIACIIAFNPVSFYFTICYTESLFLMLILLFMIAISKKKWFLAGVIGFFAGITRNSGVFLVIIFFMEYFHAVLPEYCGSMLRERIKHYIRAFLIFIWHFRLSYFRVYRSFLNIMLIPAGTVMYFIYLFFRFGSLSSSFSAVDQFGRSSMAPWLTLYRGIQYNFEKITTTDKTYILNYFLLELIAVAVFLFAVFYLIKRVPLAYDIFMTVSLVLPLCKPAYLGLVDYFTSFPRYTITLFPYFVALYGIFHKSRKAFIFYLAASIYMLIRCVSFWSIGKFIA